MKTLGDEPSFLPIGPGGGIEKTTTRKVYEADTISAVIVKLLSSGATGFDNLLNKLGNLLGFSVGILGDTLGSFTRFLSNCGLAPTLFTIILFIILIIVFIFAAISSGNNSRGQPIDLGMRYFKKMFSFSHKTKMMLKSYSQFGEKLTNLLSTGAFESIKKSEDDFVIQNIGETMRERFDEGRCNNLTIIESGPICVSTTVPKPIEWIIDPDKLSDYNNISQEIKNKLIDNGGKYKITIPWKLYESDKTQYYPNCSEAKFCNGESAAYLFTNETPTKCSKKRVKREEYSEQKRPTVTSWNGLTNYLT